MVQIAVLGCGNMGLKIAGNFAYSGHTVKLFDSDMTQLAMANQRIERDRDQLYRDGLIESTTFPGQILPLSQLEDAVKDVHFVFECIFENLELKRNLVEKVAQHVPPNVIICSNTMQLDLEKISENLPCKQNFLGVRFLFPVYYIREVELNLTKWTSAETINNLRKLLEPMDKVLFFRSSSEPLILNDEQRESRRRIRWESIRQKRANVGFSDEMLPELTFASSLSDTSTDQAKANQAKLECLVCMDQSRNAVIQPCNHMATCHPCAQVLCRNCQPCPVCRTPITDIIRIYI